MNGIQAQKIQWCNLVLNIFFKSKKKQENGIILVISLELMIHGESGGILWYYWRSFS